MASSSHSSKLWTLLMWAMLISLLTLLLLFNLQKPKSAGDSEPFILIDAAFNCSPPNIEGFSDLQGAPANPYHNWKLFQADYQRMLSSLKIYAYPETLDQKNPFSNIFLPHPNPEEPKLGNYYSEHMFKINLLRSQFLTHNPNEAHFFFLPFSINALRNDPRVHSEEAIIDFVANYSRRVSRDFGFWNKSRGATHFYVCCHSVGRDVSTKFLELHRNSIQVVCSSSYFQKFYVPHKDISLPQIWPRSPELQDLNLHKRSKLAFFAGRVQNSKIRQKLISTWKNDTDMDILSGKLPYSYREGFKRSKYCLHVKGYEVNTARVSDAIFYGCVPVIVSDHYELPFANVLDWKKFSVIISYQDIENLKSILLSISDEMYESFFEHLDQVRKHFQWHTHAEDYDSFYMVMYQLWLRRGLYF